MPTPKMPALFIGHGSPMNALRENDFTRTLKTWGQRLPRPEAILVISAHWQTDGTRILSQPYPKTIYDFYGFPDKLYTLTYPAPGHPQLARRTLELLETEDATLTEDWGLDHGAWSVLIHLFPKADIPVYQLSLDRKKSERQHYATAQRLRSLRSQGVLILASGNIVHNLSRFLPGEDATPYPWAVAFDQNIRNALQNRDSDCLTDYKLRLKETAEKAVPTPEHYLPLLYAAAAATPEETARFQYEGFEHASISMRAVQWG